MENKGKYWDNYWKDVDEKDFDINDFQDGPVKDLYVKILPELQGIHNSTVLDIGGGNGNLLNGFVSADNDCYVIDISEKQIRIALKRGLKGKVSDIETKALPYEDNFFDFILLTEVVEHIQDSEKLFGEIFRVLKKGGKLLVTTPNMISLSSRIRILFGFTLTSQSFDGSHIRFFRFQDLEALLKKAGFQILKKETTRCYVPTISKGFFRIPTLEKLNRNFGEHLLFSVSKE